MRSDSEIKRDVEEELRWNPDIDATDVAADVKNGIVTLTGYAPNFNQKWEAESAAKRVAGVVAVVNQIEVRLPALDQRADTDIARDAVTAVQYALPEAADNIRVMVADCVVTLEGDVEWNAQRMRVEAAVRRVRGVKDVRDLIQLRPRTEPVGIKEKVEAALRRIADVDASRITVEANGGEVTLKGTERNCRERDEAERAAWSAPGVTKVDNQLVVSP